MIDLRTEGDLRICTLRHGKVNALDLELCLEFDRVFRELEREAPAAVVLTGEGKSFSAGVDLHRVVEGGTAYAREFLPAMRRAFETLAYFSHPLVVAANGHAIAGGTILLAAGDARLVAKGAKVGVPELQVGVPFPSIALEMVRRVVPAQYRDLVILGAENETAEQAVVHGVAEEATAPDALAARGRERARWLAGLAGHSFSLVKRALREPMRERVAAAQAHDAAVDRAWEDPATREHIRAFLARTIGR